MKIEKITLWTCTETYGSSQGLSALDYIIPRLDGVDSEFKLLDYETEDYSLTPTKKERNG